MKARLTRAVSLAGVLLGMVLSVPATAQVDIERLMATPFPSGLVSAPTSAKLAWVQNAEGVRNIWIAEAPDYYGRQLTQYMDDDGQEVTSLNWTPDGQHLVFVYGGAPNRQGEIPNPTSDPDGADRSLWTISTGGTNPRPRKLADGSSPAIAPDGERVAFLRQGQIWTIGLENGDEAEQLLTIRGRAGSLRWSPNGSSLAFVSSRGDHSFVGVYEVIEDQLQYLDPSVDSDGNPVWSPDGERIAYTRIPNDRSILPFMARRSALPWSIRVADIATGEGSTVWQAEEGPGSPFHAVVAQNQLFWGDGDRIVFPWEGDGWVHLYSVSANGGSAALLTPGEFEVEDVTLTPAGQDVVFSSNQDDIDRRHIWRVSVGGGPATAVTSGQGIEWSPTVTTDGEIAHLASDARLPAHAVIIRNGRRSVLADGILDDFPFNQLVEPEQVIFSGADGMQIHGQLFVPGDLAPGDRRPAILFFHGGSRRQMLLGWHYRGYYHNAYAMNQFLASRGYIVLAVNYRSGTGYGMEFREALNYGARGASEYNDVTGAGLYLRSRPDVDPDRIGLWGGSYGGYLTAMGLARSSDLFAAGVDLHGVHDWNVVIRNFRQDYDPNARAEHARLAFESSPMYSIDGWRSPVLLIHGDDDRNVPFSESVDLAESLRNQGVEFEQLIFPDEVHGFLLHRNWLSAYRATADFFDRKLRGRNARISQR